MNNTIRLYQIKETITPYVAEDKFRFNPGGKLPWLQKIAFWLLKKLRAQVIENAVAYSRVEIPLDDLVKAIFENQRNVQMLTNKTGAYVIVGHDAFCKLNQSADQWGMRPFSFFIPQDFQARVAINNAPAPQMFAGMKVIVVPWIDGVFILPDVTAI